MWNFLIGFGVGWFISRNPGVVSQTVQSALAPAGGPDAAQPGGNSSGGVLYAQPAAVYVGPGTVAAPASGAVGWSGCPQGQGAYQDPNTGQLRCVPTTQLQGFGRWRH